MKRRAKLLMLVLVVVVMGGLGWLIFSSHAPPEPVYKGRRLSEWLSPTNPITGIHIMILSDKPPVDELLLEPGPKEAVGHIGTNAIPTLLRLLRAHDSSLRLKLVGLLRKQHLVKINFSPAGEWNAKAAAAFDVLGADASNAVPDLIRILKQDFSASSQALSADALGSIGPAALAAVPELLRIAAKTNAHAGSSALASPPGLYVFGQVHDHAMAAIHRMEADPGLAMRALKQSLKDPNPASRKLAATELVGLLMELESASRPWMRFTQTSYTIGTRTFDRDPRAPIPSLADVLKDPDADVRINVAQAFKAVDPEAAAKAGIK